MDLPQGQLECANAFVSLRPKNAFVAKCLPHGNHLGVINQQHQNRYAPNLR